MNITMENFNYKGHHFDRLVAELPGLHEIDEEFEERIGEYLVDALDNLIKVREEES